MDRPNTADIDKIHPILVELGTLRFLGLAFTDLVSVLKKLK